MGGVPEQRRLDIVERVDAGETLALGLRCQGLDQRPPFFKAPPGSGELESLQPASVQTAKLIPAPVQRRRQIIRLRPCGPRHIGENGHLQTLPHSPIFIFNVTP